MDSIIQSYLRSIVKYVAAANPTPEEPETTEVPETTPPPTPPTPPSKYLAKDDILGWSIWTERPHKTRYGWDGYDPPYNSKCVYVSGDLIKLLFPDLEWQGEPIPITIEIKETL